MNLRLVDSGWSAELTSAMRTGDSTLCIISPFIKSGALNRLLALKPRGLRVITRYNLDDFAAGVSDIAALRCILAAGGRVRGIRNLHAKLYLFGTHRAIVTSANLTSAALDYNHEFGVVTDELASIASCQAYFDRFWKLGRVDLSSDQLDSWDETVTRRRAAGDPSAASTRLGDFGADAGIDASPATTVPVAVADAPRAFVKFLGESGNRVPLSFHTVKEIELAGCHRVLAYPATKRPRSVRDDALMYIARLTAQPNDIRIFGRGVGMAHVDERDSASDADILHRPWRGKWSRYVRVHQVEFVAGTMANGVSLNELMDELGSDAFASTQRNAANGEGNTDPRHAYLQAAHVELSADGLAWIRDRLQSAFDEHGVVPRDVLAAIHR